MLDWEQLKRHWTGLELWRTPTKYLVCIKYESIFRFFNTLRDATQTYEEMRDYLEDSNI